MNLQNEVAAGGLVPVSAEDDINASPRLEGDIIILVVCKRRFRRASLEPAL